MKLELLKTSAIATGVAMVDAVVSSTLLSVAAVCCKLRAVARVLVRRVFPFRSNVGAPAIGHHGQIKVAGRCPCIPMPVIIVVSVIVIRKGVANKACSTVRPLGGTCA